MSSNLIIDKDIITNPEQALQYEWLESNGLGGYASSTIYNCNIRKYHGLLVAPIPEYGSRYVLLSKYLCKVVEKQTSFKISTSKFPGVYHPNGHKYFQYFTYVQGYPQILIHIGDIKILKSIVMPQGLNAVIVHYEVLQSDSPLTFQLSPLLAYREYHCLQKNNFSVCPDFVKEENQWKASPYAGMPSLYFKTNVPAEFHTAPEWYENFELTKEESRGYDYLEDLYIPGVFEVRVKNSFMILASLESKTDRVEDLWKQELDIRNTRNSLIAKSTKKQLYKHDAYRLLKEQAHKFIVTKARENAPSIMAGFPWFGEWGRDSMISLPGLSLYNGQEALCLDIVKVFIAHNRNGLIPNQLNVYGESSYNSVDASLWIFWVLQQYIQKLSRNKGAAGSAQNKSQYTSLVLQIQKEFGASLQEILAQFLNNQVPNVHLVEEGFLSVGSPHTQLTWMDANVNGKPATPRHGHPIEINALWYNALKFYQELSAAVNKKSNKESNAKTPAIDGNFEQDLVRTIVALETHFEQCYYDKEQEQLFDTIIYNNKIQEIRPNQLVALALPYSLISSKLAERVFKTVSQHLLTPMGLRTLSPNHSSYKGVYIGNQEARDAQYHQGTVWPFLIGVYTDAFLKVHKGDGVAIKAFKEKLLHELVPQVYEKGIGSLAEIHDGNMPHVSRGSPFQAWSVAETIRAIELLEEAQL